MVPKIHPLSGDLHPDSQSINSPPPQYSKWDETNQAQSLTSTPSAASNRASTTSLTDEEARQTLETWIENSVWYENDELEPVVGAPVAKGRGGKVLGWKSAADPRSGWDRLRQAISKERVTPSPTLLQKVAQWGIDVGVQNVNGFTALYCAYLRGDLDAVRVLKGYGADEDIGDNLGRQPVHMYTQITSNLGKSSPSSDRTSSLVQMSSAWEEQWEASMTPFQSAHSSDNETMTDPLDNRREPLHTCESTTSARVMAASMAVPSFVCDNSFAMEEAGGTDGVSETKSNLSIPVERSPSPTSIQSLPVTTPGYARSYEQELEQLRAITPSAIHTRRDLQPSVPENTGTWPIYRAPEVCLPGQEDNSPALGQATRPGLTAPLAENTQRNSTHLSISDHGDSFASPNSFQASPPDTQARMGMSTTQPSRSQCSVLSFGPSNESSHIAMTDTITLAKMDQSLRRLERIIDASAWLRDNWPEPRIGNPDCPAEANQYGLRGESVFTAFVEDHEDGTYGCKRQLCHVYSTRSLDEAVRHQRHYHFNHAPYACIPASGAMWYVSSYPVRWSYPS